MIEEIFQGIFFGILQGLTEFLPVSSSGHLVLAQKLANFSSPGILLETTLHAGTLLAIVFYFRETVFRLDRKLATLIIVGSVPAGVVGFLLSDGIKPLFESLTVVGAALIVTAFLNYFVDQFVTNKKTINYKDALFIGVFQAFAIIPGLSRSGSTIFAGTFNKIDRKTAASFSFLLSIPAVLGANILEFASIEGGNHSPWTMAFGFIFSFIFGYLAIEIIFKILEKKRFWIFSLYALVVGVGVLLLK